MFETVIFLDSAGQKYEDFTTYFQENIVLDPNNRYKIALISADLWYSRFNVTEENNEFTYKSPSGTRSISIPPGAYNVPDLNKEIQRLMGEDGSTITPNYNTLRAKVTLKRGYEIDFTKDNSLRNILGFDSRVVKDSGDGDRAVNITEIKSSHQMFIGKWVIH